MNGNEKIRSSHLSRTAWVYLRQSSPSQVENNRESTDRQYKLKELALSLGWSSTQVTTIDEDLAPIVLGRIRFPQSGGMTLEINSIPRAIEGARFFGPRLGSEVVAMRCRLVNRCFASDEGKPDELLKVLDRDVTVIDPRAAEEEFKREFAGVGPTKDVERAAAAIVERRLKSKRDVPLVEDFPLAPEEENPEFRDLSTTLQLRMVRAVEHWRGNTHLTLAAIIVRTVEEGLRTSSHQEQ